MLQVPEVAKKLGISPQAVNRLVDQQILHPEKKGGVPLFSEQEVNDIAGRRHDTLSDDAAQVRVQIEREVVSKVGTLQSYFKRIFWVALGATLFFSAATAITTYLFIAFPTETSDFFGYYYRLNRPTKQAYNAAHTQEVLAASTNGVAQTSVIADVLQPVAATSLVVLKATNNQNYGAIVTNPTSGTPGPAGAQGPPGPSGRDGRDGSLGPAGLSGVDGVDGSNGTNGTNGSNGSNGANGTSAADQLTTPGDILIRDSTNITTRLAIGASGQVLTVSTGVPSWQTPASVNFNGDVTGTPGASIVSNIRGAVLGTTTASTGNILVGSGTAWVSQALSGDITVDATGSVALKPVGTAGTYGAGSSIPVFTTDARGRVTNVTNTAISGLTVTNFGSNAVSQWNNDSGYTTASSSNILSNKTIAAGSNTISGITNANLSGTAGITNANLLNSSLTVNTSGPLSGGGTVSLGGSLTLSCPTCLTSSGALFTAIASSGANSSIDMGGTLSLASGTNITTTNNGAGTITFATSTTPTFTTINGLTITNNGTNTLAIAAGKTLTVNRSLTFTGTDGTTFTLPSASDTLVGLASNDTLTNKTIAAGSNTISGLTNSNLSGTAGITNANLQNSSLTVSTSGPLSGGGLVALGGSLSLSCPTCLTSGGTLFGLKASTGSDSSIAQGGTVTLTAGTNMTTNNNGTGGVTFATSATPAFTTINGLTITNNGTNTLSLAAGKTFTVNNSFSLSGTDSTAFTLPNASDTLVGLTSSGTLTNKIIAAGSNTISGLTNANLSGTAGITNANLQNSGLTVAGNSGTASVSLGGTLTILGSGITAVTGSGSTMTITSTEADTLQSVTTRGNSTTTNISTTGTGTITSAGLLTASNGFTLASGALTLNTVEGSPANTTSYVNANIGNVASTAQNNFTTLNLKNGGTGYLDVELQHGMIDWPNMNTFGDDFMGRALDTTTKWQAISTSGAGNTCSATFITGTAGLNGILQFTTSTTAGRGCDLSTQATLSNGFYQRGNNPVFETKLSLSNTTNARIYAGFTNTKVAYGGDTNASTHHAYIGKRSTDTQWQCITDDGGATDNYTTTGVTINTSTWYRLRVEVRSGSTPETICTVDDGTTITRVATTSNQPGATSPMDIYLKVENGGDGAITANWDYVRTWQDDRQAP